MQMAALTKPKANLLGPGSTFLILERIFSTSLPLPFVILVRSLFEKANQPCLIRPRDRIALRITMSSQL